MGNDALTSINLDSLCYIGFYLGFYNNINLCNNLVEALVEQVENCPGGGIPEIISIGNNKSCSQ